VASIVIGSAAYFLATGDDSGTPELLDSTTEPGDVSAPGIAEPGDPAPDFRAETLTGGEVGLADFVGRPLVLNFWASWCEPCRREFPWLRSLAHGDDVAVLGVTFDDIASDSRRFAEDFDADWPLAMDPTGEIARMFGVRAIPQTIFVDRNGTIRSRVYGLASKVALDRHVDELR